jgi:hypothetical protein
MIYELARFLLFSDCETMSRMFFSSQHRESDAAQGYCFSE